MLQVPLAFLSSYKKANSYGLKGFVYKETKIQDGAILLQSLHQRSYCRARHAIRFRLA
jgi:hypothetical protein